MVDRILNSLMIAGGTLVLLATAYVTWCTFSQVRRRRKLADLAAELGLTYTKVSRLSLYDRFSWSGLFLSNEGNPGNVLNGCLKGRQVVAFDFRGAKGAVGQMVYSRTAAVISFPSESGDFSCLAVKPKGVAGAMWSEGIEFESHAFNTMFQVQCANRKFAYALITPLMMEYLIANPGWSIMVCGSDALISTGRLWSVEQFRKALAVLSGFVEHVPRHLTRQARQTAWNSDGDADGTGSRS